MTKYKIIHTPFYYLTLVSLVILLFIGAIMFTSALLTVQLPRIFHENIQLLAEMQLEAGEKESAEVLAYLKEHPDVLGSSVEYIPRSEALEMMEDAMGAEILLADQTNPFMDIVKFRLSGEKLEKETVDRITSSLTSEFPVVDVYYPQEAMGMSGNVISQLSGVLLVVFLGLLLLVFILIHQIMRMNIVSNRFMIRTMEIVGASKKFIMRPFVREALKLAAMAALITCGLYLALVLSLSRRYGEIQFDGLPLQVIYAMIFICLLSFIISLMSTTVAVQRQLGKGYGDY